MTETSMIDEETARVDVSRADGRGGPGRAETPRRWRPVFNFARHYVEMLLVMALGMLVLGGGLILLAIVAGAGWSELEADAPALILIGMGFSMTAPMIWWMHRRGHTWGANGAMAAAMILPTLATLALLIAGTVEDLDVLLMIEHLAMFPTMLVAMLLHRAEYTHAPPGIVSGNQQSLALA